MNNFDGNIYNDTAAANAVAGKNIMLCIYAAEGASELLAVAGQKGLKINRSTDTVDITSKDAEGGWKTKIAGMKEWSIETDGLYVPTEKTHAALEKAFVSGSPVAVKVTDMNTKKECFGGIAVINEYSFEAPFDEAMTYSISLEGAGALTSLSE